MSYGNCCWDSLGVGHFKVFLGDPSIQPRLRDMLFVDNSVSNLFSLYSPTTIGNIRLKFEKVAVLIYLLIQEKQWPREQGYWLNQEVHLLFSLPDEIFSFI